ncbi:pas domain s-box family protein [Stylonychia lemnae]|uniref:Pas domain s-box family protein n=1 Tax=Stylonychia lemnae TaxID=5949 RepID=A0A078A054_STYLE|nr:pas domain s-box family protein [Stylonychia lemnae]|eukprot:CDW75262.1 pas domain s-box family protein [Stylonychia lemnae]
MVERQNIDDLNLLHNIIHTHRMKCLDINCTCQMYFKLIISQFKKNDEHHNNQILKSHSKKGKRELQITDQSSFILIKTANLDQISDNFPGSYHQPDDIGDQISYNEKKLQARQSDWVASSIINLDSEQSPTHDQNILSDQSVWKKALNHVEGTQPVYSQAQTFSFDTNLIVSGISIDDMFKEIFEIENLNQKLMNNSSSLFLNNHSNSKSQLEKNIYPGKKLKFADQMEARKYLFIQILEIIFKDYEQNSSFMSSFKHPEYQLQYINFINKNLQKHFLAIFQLLKINQNKKKLGFFERIQFSICEQLIIQEALLKFKNNSGGFDYSYFIDGNHKQQELDSYFEKATLDILEFWKKIKSDDPSVQQILELGTQISDTIYRLKILTKKLEDDQILKKDLGKYQIYALFHLEMLHDPVTSSQMASFIKNNQVLRSKSKFFGMMTNNNGAAIQLHNQISDVGVSIISAWNGAKSTWEFLYGNKAFCDLFKISESNLQGRNINQIMPKPIALNHDQIIKKFYLHGHPKVLGKLRVLIAKANDGYLIPIQLRINFYYNLKFSYSFVAQAERVKYWNIFNEEQNRIPMSDCMILLTDEELNVLDFSKSFVIYTGITAQKIENNEEMTGYKENLLNIIEDIQKILQQDFGNNSNLPKKAKAGLVNKIVQCRKFNQVMDSFDNQQNFPCLLNYVQERYQTINDEIRLNIFMILPLNKHPDFELMATQKGIYTKKFSTQQAQFKKTSSTGNPITEGRDIQDKSSMNSESGNFDLSSLSSTNSSSNSNAIQSHYAKNLLFQRKAPKILKINAIVLACTIVSFLIISIYNLAVFTDKHQQISGRLTAMSYISQRNANMRATLLDIKTIHLIVQDLKNLNQSTVLPANLSRIDYYLGDMQDNLQIVRDQADKLNRFIALNKEYFSFNLNFENLTFLTDYGYIYKISVVFKQATKLLNSYSETLKIDDFISQKPNLNVTNYAKNYSFQRNDTLNRSLTALEQSLFFIFENGMYTQQELGQRQLLMLQEASFEQTESSQTTLMVTTFVSIGIVSLICIIIFPLLTKVLDRIYTVLKFYNNLDKAIIEKCHQQGLEFKKQLRTKIGNNKQKYSQQQNLSISIANSKLKPNQNDKNNDRIDIQDNKNQQSDQEILSSRRFTKETDSNRGLKEQDIQITFSRKTQKKLDLKKQDKQKIQGPLKQYVSNSLKSAQKDEKLKNRKRISVNLRKLEQIEEEKEEESESESEYQDNKSPQSERHKQRNAESKKNRRRTKLPQNQEEKREIKNKLLIIQIRKRIFAQKLKIFMFVFLMIGYLNSSLLISYYQSQNVFKYDKDSVISLQKAYFREECAYNLQLLMREKIIRNYTLNINLFTDSQSFVSVPAIYNYVDRCFENENYMSQLRRNYPEYYQEAKEQVEIIEGPGLCNATFLAVNPTKANLCERAMDGILAQGQSNALYQLISFIQQTNINLDSSTRRNRQFLDSLLYQKRMQEFADLSLYYLKTGFDLIQDILKTTAISYFDLAKQNYILTFGLFMSFTVIISFVLGVIVFRRVKKAILDVQNMLILLPLEELDLQLRQKIEAFLNK